MMETQGAKLPPSRRHANWLPASLAANAKLGELSLLGFPGFFVIVVVGAAVSIVQEYVSAVPVLPAASVARTENVCEPAATALYVFGVTQASNAPLSSLQAKLLMPSLAVKEKVGEPSLLG